MSAVVRSYDPASAPDVLALWRRSLGDLYPLREEVLRGSLEGNASYRPGDALIAWDDGRALGFGYVGLLRESDPEMADQRGRAWLQAVVVDPAHRRSGLGSRIVAGLTQVAEDEGIVPLECGSGFFYLWPGLPADLPDARPFAEALGFTIGERTWDLRGDVSGLSGDTEAAGLVTAAGMRTGPATAADREPLLAFIAREFGGEWWHDIRWFLDAGGDSGEILLLRSSDASGAIAGFAHLHTPASRPIGWPLYWAARLQPGAGGLGPIGIAERLRGRGLGKALLTLGLARLRDARSTDVVIDGTNLLGFYGQLGFRPWMEFVHARGTVPDVLRRARLRRSGDTNEGGDR